VRSSESWAIAAPATPTRPITPTVRPARIALYSSLLLSLIRHSPTSRVDFGTWDPSMGVPKGHRNLGVPESNNIFTSPAIPTGGVQDRRQDGVRTGVPG